MDDAASPAPPELVQFLAERDTPCPGCGYNLRGLRSSRCPECEQPLVLSVQLAEPRLAAFLCGVIGLGAGLGFNGIIGAWWIYAMVMQPPRMSFSVPWSLLFSLLIFALLLWLWVRRRPWIRRQNPGLQWFMGLWAWILTVISAIWFFATVP